MISSLTNPWQPGQLRKYLVISDVHLGARSTTAEEILTHLTAYFDHFTAKSQFADIDVLFIAGDLWDDTINFSSDVLSLFLPWFDQMLRWCSRHEIKVRILEGTPRHDRQQGLTLQKIAELLPVKVDFKYVPTLSIERMNDLGLSVLYVPDECRHTAEIVARDVDELLNEENLTQVDIAIMHGMFQYQLGTIPMNSKVHDELWYLQKVKHYLSIGHIHTHSQYERIVAQGSFDRLAHGEEGPKGAVLIQETAPNQWMHFFIENPLAKKYVTIAVKGDIDQALKTIERGVKHLPDGSFVRIQALATHPIFQGFETLRRKHPFYVFTKKALVKEEEVVTMVQAPVDYTPIVLNRDTLTEALFSEITGQHSLEMKEERLLHELLETLHT